MCVLPMNGTEPHLLQVLETLILSPHDGAHSAQGRLLQLLAPVERIAKLHQPDVVLGHIINQVFSCIDLPQGQFVVILVVQDIHQISVKRMDVIKLREFIDDRGEFIVISLLREFDFSHVELSDSRDLVVFANDCGCLALRL